MALELVDPRDGKWSDPLVVVILLAYAVVGGLIGSRQPGNAVAWLLGTMSVLMIGAFFVGRYALTGYDQRLPLPAVGLTAAFGWLWMAALGCPVLIAFVVPTGHPATPGWRRAMIAVAATFVTVVVAAALGNPTFDLTGVDASQEAIANPLYVPALGPLYAFIDSAFVIYVAVFAVGAAALVSRFRGAAGIERQQLKWVAAGIVLMVAAMTGSNALPQPLGDLSFGLALLALPVALGISILRFRLYDIDRIISRTVAYALLTALLAATFVAIVIVFQTLLAPVMQSNSVAVATSTLVVAALFQPLRRRVQTSVDHRFDRRRYDAERVVQAFGGRVRNEVDVETLSHEVEAVAAETVRPVSAVVWLPIRAAGTRRPTL